MNRSLLNTNVICSCECSLKSSIDLIEVMSVRKFSEKGDNLLSGCKNVCIFNILFTDKMLFYVKSYYVYHAVLCFR